MLMYGLGPAFLTSRILLGGGAGVAAHFAKFQDLMLHRNMASSKIASLAVFFL
jgi:hypothetical protein